MALKFKIVICGGYCEKYIGWCLQSLKDQTYRDWDAVCVLDRMDGAASIALDVIKGSGISLIVNGERRELTGNQLSGIRYLQPDDEDVVVMIDADDWLPKHNALQIVADRYAETGCLMTHGSIITYPDNIYLNCNAAYTQEDYERGVRKSKWKASHLKTVKYGLVKRIKDEDLRGEDGKYFSEAGDMAFMYPCLEMAGLDRVAFIPDIIYAYNLETPFNAHKTRREVQFSAELYMRDMKPYQRVDFEKGNCS